MTTGAVTRRLSGGYDVDESGFDEDVASIVRRLVGLGCRVAVDGVERLPGGAAVLVHNRLLGPPEVLAVAHGIGVAGGRWVRFLGLPDVAPVGPALRRLGGASSHPAEVAGLLRAGHLVSVGARRSLRRRATVHDLPPSLAAVAVDLDVLVVPVAVSAGRLPGTWRVVVGSVD